MTRSNPALERVVQVAKRLGVDKTTAKVITVTGTNGKGSCVEMLTSVYVNAGYRVGTYTSPHLFHFNERIRIQKTPINDTWICTAFEQVEKSRKNIALNYFEWVTLAALWIFKEANIDVMLLEVGLGGRLDTTNILDADLAIITSIGLDHMDYFGHTREAVAQEKMGICRKGRLAICGDPFPPETLIKAAQTLDTHMTYLSKDFSYTADDIHWNFYSQHQTFEKLDLPRLLVNNAAVVLQSILLMHSQLPINIPKAIQSIITTKLIGRGDIQKMPNGATLIFDVAHNPQAASQLATFLKPYTSKKIIALFSMLKDKDIEGTIGAVKNIIHEWHTAEINSPRRATKEQLNAAFNKHQISPLWHTDLQSAERFIKNQLTEKSEDSVCVIFGSFFVVSVASHIKDYKAPQNNCN